MITFYVSIGFQVTAVTTATFTAKLFILDNVDYLEIQLDTFQGNLQDFNFIGTKNFLGVNSLSCDYIRGRLIFVCSGKIAHFRVLLL